jgi:chromosome segregation ATPase
MATMTMEQILAKVQELKDENKEKDEVIREQQRQLDEVHSRLKDAVDESSDKDEVIAEQQRQLEKAQASAKEWESKWEIADVKCQELEEKMRTLSETANRADELFGKLSEVLG